MNKKRKIQILVLLLAALAVGIIALAAWIGSAKKSVTVYDFSRTIQYDEKSNYALTSADLEPTEILAADVKEEYVTNPQEVIGKYITGTAYKGQHIIKHQVQTDPTYVEVTGLSELAEYRKIYIPVSYKSGFAGDIKSGQFVDLMFTESGTGLTTDRTSGLLGSENGLNYAHAKIFMQNIPVYQVYTADGSVYNKKTTDPETLNKFKGNNAATLKGEEQSEQNTGEPAYVALTVTVPQYEEISVRMMYGTISLVSRFENSADQTSDGYLIIKDGYANIYAGDGNLEFDHNVASYLDSGNKNDVTNTRPSIYSFLRRMAMVSMTDAQYERYKSIDKRYSEFMTRVNGSNWQNLDPDSVTDQAILNSIEQTDEELLNTFIVWKMDVEELAKELMTDKVVLPWQS